MTLSLNTNTIEDQIELETLFDKNQTVNRITEEFITRNDGKFIELANDLPIPNIVTLTILVQIALHKRLTPSALIGILYTKFKKDLSPQECSQLVELAILYGLVSHDSSKGILIVRYDISEKTQRELDHFQYPLPTIIKPKKVKNNSDTGYYQTKGSMILRKNHHNEDICLDHINRVNKIPLCINLDTATMIKNKWKNLDKQKLGESLIDFKKRVKAFTKYNSTTFNIINLLIHKSNRFYLTHKYDKRGRIYCQGYHVTYQGTEWNKAVIELADKELVV